MGRQRKLRSDDRSRPSAKLRRGIVHRQKADRSGINMPLYGAWLRVWSGGRLSLSPVLCRDPLSRTSSERQISTKEEATKEEATKEMRQRKSDKEKHIFDLHFSRNLPDWV